MYPVQRRKVDLSPVDNDDQHYGPAISAYQSVFATPDGMIDVGCWDFRGEQYTRGQQQGYEEIVIITEGSVQIECDGAVADYKAGDVIIYVCPIGPKRIYSPNGFKASYVVRYRAPRGTII